MQKNRFGKTELQVTPLGFGAAPIGLLDTEQRQVEQILNFLLDQGVNVIDTAAGYRGSEKAVGRAVSHRRSEYVLVSKCGQAFEDLQGEAWSAQVIEQTVDRSLKHLQTDHLDVMLLHSCSLDTLEKGEALGALVKAREAGKVRYVGYSGDNEVAAYAAGLDEVAVVEMSINIADQANIDRVLPVCREHDVGVIAKRPIANAAWKSPEHQRGFYADYASEYSKRLKAMGVEPFDLGYHGHREVEWPEIALRFTLSQPGVHTAIVGTTSKTNAQANITAVAKGSMREQAIGKLRDAFKRASAGHEWRGQT